MAKLSVDQIGGCEQGFSTDTLIPSRHILHIKAIPSLVTAPWLYYCQSTEVYRWHADVTCNNSATSRVRIL